MTERDRLVGVATFAAGCFWGVEQAFRDVPGVLETSAGYTGGTVPSPSYLQVSTGATGHAEAVRVEFDPGRVSYEELLDVFWSLHDPTRQRVGRRARYRSTVFVHSREQERAAHASVAERSAFSRRTVLTQIVRAPLFYRAEERHQRYLEKRRQATPPPRYDRPSLATSHSAWSRRSVL